MSADSLLRDNADELAAAMADAVRITESALDALIGQPSGAESRLIESMRYASLNGGKRLRAFLVLEIAGLFDVPRSQAARVAASVEMLHALFAGP